MTDVALKEKRKDGNYPCFPLSPLHASRWFGTYRSRSGQGQVRAMSEPGISLHPISETDEEMTTRSRARSPAWKIINHHMGEKSSSLYLSHITYTRKEKEQTKKRKRKTDFFWCLSLIPTHYHTTLPTLGGGR